MMINGDRLVVKTNVSTTRKRLNSRKKMVLMQPMLEAPRGRPTGRPDGRKAVVGEPARGARVGKA